MKIFMKSVIKVIRPSFSLFYFFLGGGGGGGDGFWKMGWGILKVSVQRTLCKFSASRLNLFESQSINVL